MKRIIATALVAFALGTAAGAAPTATKAQIQEIRQYAPNVDLSKLSVKDVNVLISTIHGGDTESEKRRSVMAYLR